MRIGHFFFLHRSDRGILLTLMIVSVGMLTGLALLDAKDETDLTEETSSPVTEVKEARRNNTPHSKSTETGQATRMRVERFAFDPNTADSVQLRRLGLQDWQVRNIMKYRASGGIYRKKEDFAYTYGLTQKEYRELEPYITIGPDYQPASVLVEEKMKEQAHDTLSFRRKIAKGTTVDLATADTTQLMSIPGIGSHYARRIVNLRERLGGFASINQLDEIEGFPLQAKQYLRLDSPMVRKLNLNRASVNELSRHPYINYYQAKAIVDCRRSRKQLKSLDELRLLRDFPSEALQRLEPYVEF